jgi:hypothetical protein
MIQTLNIKGMILLLDDSTQLSPQGRPIRLSSTESVGNGRFINRVLCTGTIHWFSFLDVYSEFIGFEFDECGNYLRKC